MPPQSKQTMNRLQVNTALDARSKSAMLSTAAMSIAPGMKNSFHLLLRFKFDTSLFVFESIESVLFLVYRKTYNVVFRVGHVK